MPELTKQLGAILPQNLTYQSALIHFVRKMGSDVLLKDVSVLTVLNNFLFLLLDLKNSSMFPNRYAWLHFHLMLSLVKKFILLIQGSIKDIANSPYALFCCHSCFRVIVKKTR